jgi:hypothetical protein
MGSPGQVLTLFAPAPQPDSCLHYLLPGGRGNPVDRPMAGFFHGGRPLVRAALPFESHGQVNEIFHFPDSLRKESFNKMVDRLFAAFQLFPGGLEQEIGIFAWVCRGRGFGWRLSYILEELSRSIMAQEHAARSIDTQVVRAVRDAILVIRNMPYSQICEIQFHFGGLALPCEIYGNVNILISFLSESTNYRVIGVKCQDASVFPVKNPTQNGKNLT